MKYATVQGIRTEAVFSGQRGICPGCQNEVVARCGSKRIAHWAHLSGRDCDPWHEPETIWHRRWKTFFPNDWQEKDFTDPKTGEHHRADVHTNAGLTIEFQHSAISSEERIARENFYSSIGSMIWVVDGNRTKRNANRFHNNQLLLMPCEGLPRNIFTTTSPKILFPDEWLTCQLPVFFDFSLSLDYHSSPADNETLFLPLPHFYKLTGKYFIISLTEKNFVFLSFHNKLIQYIITCINNIQKQITLPSSIPIAQPHRVRLSSGQFAIIRPGTKTRNPRKNRWTRRRKKRRYRL